jgi:IclR family acetate operon transcriptional repressor
LLAKSSSSRCPSKERDDTDLMAFLPQEEEQDALVSRLSLDGAGPRAITDPDRPGEELARTKERGYAVDDKELGEGVYAVGVPVLDGGVIRRHR